MSSQRIAAIGNNDEEILEYAVRKAREYFGLYAGLDVKLDYQSSAIGGWQAYPDLRKEAEKTCKRFGAFVTVTSTGPESRHYPPEPRRRSEYVTVRRVALEGYLDAKGPAAYSWELREALDKS